MLALLALHLGPRRCWRRGSAPRLGRRVFLLVALAPAATAVWAATRAAEVLDGRPVMSTHVVGARSRADARPAARPAGAAASSTLVAGVGTLVFLYCAQYFSAAAGRASAASPAC